MAAIWSDSLTEKYTIIQLYQVVSKLVAQASFIETAIPLDLGGLRLEPHLCPWHYHVLTVWYALGLLDLVNLDQ